MKFQRHILYVALAVTLSGCNLFGSTEAPTGLNGSPNNATDGGMRDMTSDGPGQDATPTDMRPDPDVPDVSLDQGADGGPDADMDMQVRCDCIIDAACLLNGDPNPANPCEACDATVSESAWTPQAEGASCQDGDGLDCTMGTCDAAGVCQPNLELAACLIDGVCYANAALDPANDCMSCAPLVSQTQFSPRGMGEVCTSADDGLGCTSHTCDGAGVCGTALDAGFCLINGLCLADGEADPTEGCNVCEVATSTDMYVTLADTMPCTFSACTTAECSAGTCTQMAVNAGSCSIGGICYAANEENPANDCEACSPTDDQAGWSVLPDDTSCGPLVNCDCQAGVCERPMGAICN